MKAYNMTYAPVRVFTNMLLADKFNGSSMLRNMAFDVKKTCIEATFLSAPNGSSCLEPAQHRQLLVARNSDGTRRPWLSCGHDVGKPGENRVRV